MRAKFPDGSNWTEYNRCFKACEEGGKFIMPDKLAYFGIMVIPSEHDKGEYVLFMENRVLATGNKTVIDGKIYHLLIDYFKEMERVPDEKQVMSE